MIYLDNAASSHPKPQTVYDAVQEALKTGANPGRSGHTLALNASRYILSSREGVARLIGATSASRVIFTSNATHAINQTLQGFLREGDHVVSSAMEHNSVLRPLHALEAQGISHTLVEADGAGVIDIDKVADAITPRTRLVALTHASNVTGALLDIERAGELCRARGVKFLLDASQSLGAIPIDVVASGVDMLAAPGHKGLLGPQGTGILYVGEGVELKPLITGGTGFASESREMPDELPEALEAGTLNTPGIAGLGAGVEYLLSRTVEDIRADELEIIEYLIEELPKVPDLTLYGPRDPSKRLAVFAFNIKGVDGAHVGYTLDEVYGIAVRVGLHCAPDAHKAIDAFPVGTVRASFGPFNTIHDAKKLVEALTMIASL
ncbi:MAG: cysteine desulfurase [Deltaproteobacteria bacterium]|nr:MAG: cysteine desulfurase [Deltaproteobacteria bacterium]